MVVSELLESIIQEPVTIILALVVFTSPYWMKRKVKSKQLGTMATTLGILFTFAGIVYGLLNFNVNDIQASVPLLLEGLKTAFITSIAGMVAALIVNVFPKFYFIRSEEEDAAIEMSSADRTNIILKELKEEISSANKREFNQLQKIERALNGEGDTTLLSQIQKFRVSFIDELETIKSSLEKADARQVQKLTEIQRALSGDGESTLLTQMQKMRSDILDSADSLGKKVDSFGDIMDEQFTRFAEKLAEMNNKALIEALNDILKDFNTKISEQLGDNFRRFNEALKDILIWQEKNKEQLHIITEQIQRNVKALEITVETLKATEQIVSDVADHTQSFVKASNDLSDIIQSLQYQRDDLQRHLKTFADISDKAVNALPHIQNEIDRMTAGFTEKISKALDAYQVEMEKLNNKFTGFASDTNENVKRLIQQQTESVRAHAATMRTAVDEARESIQKTQRDMNSQVIAMVDETNSKIANQFSSLDKAFGEELNKALNSLGSQLASLSRRFVDDYSPLTDKLRQIVRIAEGGNDGYRR